MFLCMMTKFNHNIYLYKNISSEFNIDSDQGLGYCMTFPFTTLIQEYHSEFSIKSDQGQGCYTGFVRVLDILVNSLRALKDFKALENGLKPGKSRLCCWSPRKVLDFSHSQSPCSDCCQANCKNLSVWAVWETIL